MINIDDEIYTLFKGKGKKNGETYIREIFTFKADETSLYPNSNNKTFVEFETDNINYSNSNKPKKTFETVKGYMGNDFEKHQESREELATFLLEVVNNYDLLTTTNLTYRNMLFDAKEDWRIKDKIIRNKYKYDYSKYVEERKQLDIKLKNTLVAILKKLLYKLARINPKLGILANYIGEYFQNCHEKYIQDIDYLEQRIARRKKRHHNLFYKLNDSLTEREQRIITANDNELKSLKRNKSVYSTFKIINSCFKKLLEEFHYVKKFIDNSFISTNKNKSKGFSFTETSLPSVKIEYMLDDNFKSPKPFKYTYEIKNLRELLDITIYQLSLTHQPILKCKNCEKYFIPLIKFDEKLGKNKRIRDDMLYCSDNCKWQYKSKNRNVEETTLYYEKLRKRYNANPTYHKELENLKALYQDCKSKQLDDEEIMRILTKFEKDVKSKYTVKRGRPKKNKNV